MKKYALTLLMATAIACAWMTGCGRGVDPEPEVAPPVSEEAKEAEETPEAVVEPTDDGTVTEPEVGDVAENADEIAGEYTCVYTEELDGEMVSAEYSYVLNADGTGTSNHQDSVDLQWDDHMIYVNGTGMKYRIEGNTLKVNEVEDVWVSYTKK